MQQRTSVDDRSEEAGTEERETRAAIHGDGCLGCLLIDYSNVTLSTGTVVCSSCPDYRHECEVRYVAAMETREHRRRYLSGVREYRGDQATERIIDGLKIMHTARQPDGVKSSDMIIEVKRGSTKVDRE